MSEPCIVVLVHGAWHGAWCWEPVLGGLADAGVPVRVVELPGHGDDPGPLGDLHGDAAAVRRVLDTVGGPVVLVGHSYGGVVVTEAGDHPAVVHLAYLAAFNLDAGESAMGAAAALTQAAAIDHSGRPDALAWLALADDGTSTVDPEGARVLFYQDCPPDLADWAVARLGPQPMVTLTQEPAAVAWRHRPSTYAVCTEDNIVHPDLQRVLARRADRVVEWPTGHSPFLARPDLVVGLLAALARGEDPPGTAQA
ncbi:MAG TPA: alpha/beta hydrolase [Acidimicrobiales bacterium]|nr:alpha/beta hydrolase [Acidimicrobiales bacterium]